MSDAEAYLTVGERGQAEFEVKGSEFIGHVAPAESVDAAEALVREVRDAYADATHNLSLIHI